MSGCGRPAVIKTLGKLYDSDILKQAIHKDDRSTHEWTEYDPSKKSWKKSKETRTRDTSIEAEERKGIKGS
jgi:hypothetical protein